MPIPQPRTESHTVSSMVGRSSPAIEALPRFATSGEIAVDVTNNLDVNVTVYLESNRLTDLTQFSNAGELSFPHEHRPQQTISPGETATFDGFGSAGTYWRAVVEWGTAPSSGDVSVTYEQLNQPRNVVISE